MRCFLSAWMVLLLAAVPTAHADEVPYRRYTVADGLPNEDVYVLAQTDDGRLYVGTPAGLTVFEGQRFRRVELPDTVRETGIYQLAVDGDAVWVGMEQRRLVQVRAGHVTRVLPRREHPIERLLVRNDTLYGVGRRGYWTLAPHADTPAPQPLRLTFRLPGADVRTDVARSLADADFGPDGHLWILDRRFGPGRVLANGAVAFADVPKGSRMQTARRCPSS